MVRDLLRHILGDAWVDRLDLASAERVNASFVSEALQGRESDVIWKFRRNDADDPVYVYLLFEFQSRPDRYMAVRMMSYMALLYQMLIAGSHLPASGLLPLVIPVVVYNGLGPWGSAQELSELVERLDPSAEAYVPRLRYLLIHEAEVPEEKLRQDSPVADLFRLERSRNWAEVAQGLDRLRQHLGPEEGELRRAFEVWLRHVVVPRMGMKADQVPQETTLEEYQSMLAERMDEWNQQMLQRGVEQGMQQGIQKGMQQGIRTGESRALLRLLEKRFGAVEPAVRDRIEAADSEVLLDWIERASTAAALDDVFS